MRSRNSISPRPLCVLALASLLVGSAGAQVMNDDFGSDDLDWYESLRRRESATPYYPGRVQPPGEHDTSANLGGGVAGFNQRGQVDPSRVPWSGVWWPRKPCELAFMAFSDGLSPLEKYDTLVFDAFGRNPGSAAWEADPGNAHNDAANRDRVDWAGHCNGLAAASILEPEPTQPIALPLSGRRQTFLKLNIGHPSQAGMHLFYDGVDDYRHERAGSDRIQLTVADQKGWLSELYMNVYTMQFHNRNLLGHRYTRPEVDIWDPTYRDIDPHYFHYLLQTFVKNRQQPIIFEVDPGFPVNNHPLYAFETASTFYPARRMYSVQTTVSYSDYANAYHAVGAKTTRATYYYTLQLDGQGRIVSGQWTGPSVYSHPDFVWIPTAIAPPTANYVNRALNYRYVKYLMGRR